MRKTLLLLVTFLMSLSGFAAENLLSSTNLPVMLQRSTYAYTDAERGLLVDGVKNATENATVNLDLFHDEKNDGFYFDLGEAKKLSNVKIFWTGKHCTNFKIYGSNDVPTLDNPGTEIGSFNEYGALNDETRYQSYAGVYGSEYRYVSYIPDATANFYGSMMSEFEIYGYEEQVLTSLEVKPAIVLVGQETTLTLSPKDQQGLTISEGVSYSVTNGTLNGNVLTATASGPVTITATLGENTATASVYALGDADAPAAPTDEFVGIYTKQVFNTGWIAAYNGGATEGAEITLGDQLVKTFTDVSCVFFYSPALGGWDVDHNPTESNYKDLKLALFSPVATSVNVVFERTTAIGDTHTQNLNAGWNYISIPLTGETCLHTISVRKAGADAIGTLLLSNIYFTEQEIDDDEAPVLADPTVVSTNAASATLSLSATDNKAENIKYTITYGDKSVTATGAAGEATQVTIGGLAPETEYTFSVVANDGKNNSDAKTVTATTTAMPKAPVPAPVRSIPIYGTKLGDAAGYAFYDWGAQAGSEITLKNTADEDVKAFQISNFTYYGSGFAQTDAVAAEMKTLHVDVYPEATTTFTIVPINGTPNEVEKGFQFNVTGGEWNSLEIPVADIIARGVTMTKLYQIKYVSKLANATANTENDGFENGDGTLSFIIANVYLEGDAIVDNEKPELVTVENVAESATVTSVTLKLKATDDKAASIKYNIVNAADANHSFTTSGANGEEITFEVTGLVPGTEYTFNVTALDAVDNESDAQQVTATTLEAATPTDPAPAPTAAAENVQAVYSDAYTTLTNVTFQNWAGTAKGEGEKALATGDNARYIIGLGNIYGIDLATRLDASEYEKLHLDIWSEAAQTIKISPIWGATQAAPKEVALAAGEWTQVDLALADFAGIDKADIYQIELVDGDGTSVIYLDNVYFWKESAATGISLNENVNANVGTTGNAIYDLQGRRVADTIALPKGIYIINGKKQVVK